MFADAPLMSSQIQRAVLPIEQWNVFVWGRWRDLQQKVVNFMTHFFAALFMAGLVGFFCWWLGPGLISDYGLRNETLVPVTDMQITEAKCRSKLFVISFCDIEAEGPRQGEKNELSYLILGSMGGENVGLLRSLEHPDVVTSNIGIDYFWNRVASFIVFGGLLAALVIGGIIGMARGGDEVQTT